MEQKKSKHNEPIEEKNQQTPSCCLKPLSNFWEKHKGKIGLVIMFIYLLLLGLGTVGEIWEIEWILDLPLFRSVGKWER